MMETFCRPFYQIERHQNTSDLVLVCKGNLKVFAHQFLLAKHSPFLKQLFTGMASLERVELVTSRVEGVPNKLKMEISSQHKISLFVPDYTASTVEILLDLIYSGQSRSTGEIDPISKQLNVINLYKDLGFDPNLMGGLPVIAELDQVLLEKRETSANHMDIKKEEYFEESNEKLTLRIMRANYDKVSSELEKLEVTNQKLEGQLLKMKENEVNRLSSSEKENGIVKATIEEIEKFKKLFEDCEVQRNENMNKLKITEKRNCELKQLNSISKLKVNALLADQSRLENEMSNLSDSNQTYKKENFELKDLNQTLKKENEAIGIGNKELNKKIDVLNKKIDDLMKENNSKEKKTDFEDFEKISCEKMELEDRITHFKEMNQKSQQKIVELKEEIDDLSDDKDKITDINKELVIKIVRLEATLDSKGKDKQGKGNANVSYQSSVEELKVLKKDLEEKEKALKNAKSDAEDLRNINNQLKKVRQSMRAKVNFAEEENTILKDVLRKLIVELDQAVSKREFNRYSNIFKQIMERVRKNSENQSGSNKECDYGRRFDSKSSSSNVNNNNNANVSKKRQSSEPDNGGQNKFVRESIYYD